MKTHTRLGKGVHFRSAAGLSFGLTRTDSGGPGFPSLSGGHVNPAISFAMCITGKMAWSKFPVYVLMQFLGAFVGSATVYGVYYGEWKEPVSALNCTISPASRLTLGNPAQSLADTDWGGGLPFTPAGLLQKTLLLD